MYEAFYKLDTSPFQLVPNTLFFYDSDTHRHGLVKLRQSLRNGYSITAVTGAPGTGKTELLRKFMSEFDVKNTVIANIPLTSLRSNNILDYIATAFGVVNMGFVGDALWSKTAFLGKIQQQISSEVCEGKKFVILIDNAESLSRNCLKKVMQLCSVRIQGMPLAQCFLFGETSVTSNLKLDVTNLGLHTISCIKLETFDEQETRRYIEHRLLEAGWQGDPEITDAAYRMIHHISDGVPWHINLLCHRVFLQGFLEDTHVIDDQVVSMFLTDRELENVGVSGSDVTTASNVINLKHSNTGSDTKRTSSLSANNNKNIYNNNNQPQAATSEVQDSISYFFDEYDKTNQSEETDDIPIAVDVVKEAFDACIVDESVEVNINGNPGVVASEEYYPEVNDRIEFALDEQQSAKVSESVTEKVSELNLRVPLDSEHLPRDRILEKIFPRTTAMLHEYSQIPFNKSYTPLNVPDFLELDELQRKELDDAQQIDNLDLEMKPALQPAPRTSAQIASRASIVTSLVITLIMWVIGDTRSADTTFVQPNTASLQSKQPPQISPRNINTNTPSPYEPSDDHAQARNILSR